jgi:multidrug efflux pump subunit AcrA (membrane-fusion protein)
VSDPGARTFLLRVEPAQPDAMMVPGMSASGELSLDTGRRALVVPRDAIIKYADGRVIVWVLQSANDGDVVVERPVITGLAFDGLVEVRSGLEAGARVVIKGNEALLAGQRVEVRG